jgi:hypothetical protein
MNETPNDPEDFDDGWLVEGEHGEAMDLAKLPAIVQDRTERFPDREKMQAWVAKHPGFGVNLRPVAGIPGAWTMLLSDETDEVFVFGEFHNSELLV